MTLDAADRSSTCPLRFPRRPFCRPLDKSSAKSQHLSPPGALGDNGERKKAIQHLCLLRLKHVAFSASLPSSLPRGNSTCPEMHLSVNSLSVSFHPWQLIKSASLFRCFILFGRHCGESADAVISRSALAQAEG